VVVLLSLPLPSQYSPSRRELLARKKSLGGKVYSNEEVVMNKIIEVCKMAIIINREADLGLEISVTIAEALYNAGARLTEEPEEDDTGWLDSWD
jgi:hypothetical protein